jgi:hypothetical protein
VNVLLLFEIALVRVRLNHVASFIFRKSSLTISAKSVGVRAASQRRIQSAAAEEKDRVLGTC